MAALSHNFLRNVSQGYAAEPYQTHKPYSSGVAMRERVARKTEMCLETGQEETAYMLWTSNWFFPLYFRQQKITEREAT